MFTEKEINIIMTALNTGIINMPKELEDRLYNFLERNKSE